jgi:hypothetical protein
MENEIKQNELICKIENKKVLVFKKNVVDKFSFVGDGILNFEIITEPNRYYHNGLIKSEWQNEIEITFYDAPWGGISLQTWNNLEEILEEITNSNIGLYSYLINPSKNFLRLSFEVNDKMEVY